jgi:hypothetical protein
MLELIATVTHPAYTSSLKLANFAQGAWRARDQPSLQVDSPQKAS